MPLQQKLIELLRSPIYLVNQPRRPVGPHLALGRHIIFQLRPPQKSSINSIHSPYFTSSRQISFKSHSSIKNPPENVKWLLVRVNILQMSPRLHQLPSKNTSRVTLLSIRSVELLHVTIRLFIPQPDNPLVQPMQGTKLSGSKIPLPLVLQSSPIPWLSSSSAK